MDCVIFFKHLDQIWVAQLQLVGHPEVLQIFQLCFSISMNSRVISVRFTLRSQSFYQLSDVSNLPEHMQQAEVDHLSEQEVKFCDCPVFFGIIQRLLQIFSGAYGGLAS
jgi:hypothetical protein